MQNAERIYKPDPAAEQFAYVRLSQPAAEERTASWYLILKPRVWNHFGIS